MGTLSRFLIIVSFFIPGKAVAQLCQGSLGDPIVNITFGAGNNPGPALTAATTTYQFFSGDCPNDGFYTVRNNSFNCFDANWHSLGGDHTANGNGYFMLVNASLQPSAFYVDTVRGLCSNTNFEFAAWVMNVLKPSACGGSGNKPNLTFTIEKTDGTVLQTYNSGSIPALANPSWNQYGFFFITPPGVSDVVLRIFNNAPGGCGNDLALDDITFRPCGPQITPSIDGFDTTAITYCSGAGTRSFTLRAALSAGFSNPVMQWQQSTDGINWTDIAGATANLLVTNFSSSTTTGKYLYRLAAADQGNFNSVKCRVVSPVLSIKIGKTPVTTVQVNAPLCEGNTATLTATGGNTYQWTKEGTNLSLSDNPAKLSNIQLTDAGKVFVLVTNDDGCAHLDSIALNIFPNPVATVSFSNTSICKGNSIGLLAGGGGTYQWSPSSGLSNDKVKDPVAAPAISTLYLATVTNANGCTDTASVNVVVIEKPEVDAGRDKAILTGGTVQLSATVSGGDAAITWSPAEFLSSSSILQPFAAPPADADYTITATSLAGCGVDIDQVHVFVFKDIYIPNAFSPDDNNRNDTWNIPALNAFSSFDLAVYNRNGQLVYQNKDSFRPWDGTYKGEPQPAGVYVYVIQLKLPAVKVLKGTILLIR